ncbi:G-protein coupled receptor 39 [Anolis carolinensis]|uniref:G-protein coupled receptor 39 n=1 Tax=Anolis carolinensis TaxID=28377 RepID=UPI000203A902|nr:PREDICTED: G-protein coupled receptor 39 [Anolis carolinensis]XP_008117050.1 PREDICTED: G-protein coupled receptor 39 [Anolis carolinensis]XP_008117051.1 PREDICTED: G-protein coupled receptor 39 [Anolis carolinensis]|eukprot:XP_003226192.1 PREDICTED: G-protein coupled receptor 39 [Anolis carolinensis]
MATQSGEPQCSDIIDHSHVKDFEVAQWIKITLALVYIIVFVAGILGNSITIQTTKVLQKKGYLQKEVTDHMVSLACSDLLVILLGMPVEFFSMIWSPFSTPQGNLACKLYCFLFEACSYATVLHVATLSFERYIAICHPFKFKATSGPCKVKLLITFVWITSVLVALPLLFAMGTEYPLEVIQGHRGLVACKKPQPRHHMPDIRLNVTTCTSLSSRWKVFQSSIFTAFIVYVVILVSVAFMCRSMMKVLMIHKQGTLAVRGETESQHQYLRKTENPESRTSRKQTILFLGLIVATLAICWLPNQVLRIMAAARPKQDWTVSYFRVYITLLPIADTFFYLSSVVNPLLYNISSKQFRAVFLQVLRCRRLTLDHINKQRFLRANLDSIASDSRYRRPLLFMSSRRKSSTKPANKISLSTFQSEAKPDCSLQKLSLEPVELNEQTMPLETSTDPSPSKQNGLCEREV